MQTVEDQYHWDDRGTAFATWRKKLEPDETEWIAFKLCYIVESIIPDEIKDYEKSSVESRLDSYFPPWTSILYIDAELNIVEDPRYLQMLKLSYQNKIQKIN